jgi:hypothetical protein
MATLTTPMIPAITPAANRPMAANAIRAAMANPLSWLAASLPPRRADVIAVRTQ